MGAGALSRSSANTERTPHPRPFPLEGKGEERAAAPTSARPTQDFKGAGDYERLTYTHRAASQARRLRREMVASERRLWEALRPLKLNIRRQAPIGRYIADFVHLATRLVIEIDSARHDLDDAQLRDYERDTWLRSQGFEVLRIRDRDAFEEPVETAERIAALIASPRR